MNIRPIIRADLAQLKAIITATDLFPAESLDAMVEGFLRGETTEEHWLTIDDSEPTAIAYFRPEPVTNGTWNLLLIAVHPEIQSKGIGSALTKHIEKFLADRGARLLLVETSGSPDFESQRRFYCNLGYREEAQIRDFYDAGEDKIVFCKSLQQT